MFFFKAKSDKKNDSKIKIYIQSKTFQRVAAAVLTILISFAIIENGAAPKKYKLSLGEKSPYDITAPRDIVDTEKAEEKAKAAVQNIKPVMKEVNTAAIKVLNSTNEFFSAIDEQRKNVINNLENQGVSKKDANYSNLLGNEQETAVENLSAQMKNLNIPLSSEQNRYLIMSSNDDELIKFRKIVNDLMGGIMSEEITEDELADKIVKVQNSIQSQDIDQDLKNIGMLFVKAVLEPNRIVDENLTATLKEKAYKEAYDEAVKAERILKDERIISFGEIVTQDKLEILEELNLLTTKWKFDYVFALGILVVLIMLAIVLIIFMNSFCKEILYSRDDIILLCVIILLTLAIARGLSEFTPLAIPIFFATMLISILLDVKLAIAVNIVLTIAISLMTSGNLQFMYIALINGAYSAFLVSKTSQRSKLSMSGIIIGLLNVLIIVCIGIINKSGVQELFNDSIIVFINGFASIIMTLGILPFFESTFNVITPLKLLELANPNQPLIKRLLMEAPGTYHHSLMVGNLAEVATEVIGGNSLLARVGAYYHDVGKLKRPNFFKENQMSDNPHDRMTANLSTLVITSHTGDGLEIAKKYKVPLAIQQIIAEHHGTTLVAYFYHKAKKCDKAENVKHENFRYEGPKPSTKESAVVMLADSVEAAVRSMVDKTEGKIEGLVRKIIKDKLDDGQLDSCNLTLKDLDDIANGFMRALSGLFHERQEYPEIKVKSQSESSNDSLYCDECSDECPIEQKALIAEEGNTNGSYNRELAGKNSFEG